MKPAVERVRIELPDIKRQIDQKLKKALQYCFDHNLSETEETLVKRVYTFLKKAHYIIDVFENQLLFSKREIISDLAFEWMGRKFLIDSYFEDYFYDNFKLGLDWLLEDLDDPETVRRNLGLDRNPIQSIRIN